jgi:uroporphyrin-III C-methyltransferase / precorrin-2 dehydrogenase / sirohydrochlorin ferrochelatase
MSDLLPLFVNLAGRRVVLVGGGPVAAAKLSQLAAAGARVRVVAPVIGGRVAAQAALSLGAASGASEEPAIEIIPRRFIPSDLDHAWLAVAAATPEVNREVAAAAEARQIFVNAVDDPANASAFLSGVIRRDGVTVAISTSGDAPALTSLLREALDAVLPRDLFAWMARARVARIAWKRDRVPMEARKPRLLRVLNALYDENDQRASTREADVARVPWLDAPENSWV